MTHPLSASRSASARSARECPKLRSRNRRVLPLTPRYWEHGPTAGEMAAGGGAAAVGERVVGETAAGEMAAGTIGITAGTTGTISGITGSIGGRARARHAIILRCGAADPHRRPAADAFL